MWFGSKQNFLGNFSLFLVILLGIFLLLFSFFPVEIVNFLSPGGTPLALNQILTFWEKIIFGAGTLCLFWPLVCRGFYKKEETAQKSHDFFGGSFLTYVFLFLLVLLVRFPYFFPFNINWDEGTYAMMGAELLKGHLPYVYCWEVKPPVTFLFYALFIWLFGRSVLAIRLGAVVCVFLAACFLKETVKKIFDEKTGFWAAIFLIIFSATLRDAGATFTEHIVLLPVTMMLFFLVTKKESLAGVFWAGFLFGMAVLVRTNQAYLVLVVVPFVFLNNLSGGIKKAGWKTLIFIAGILCLPALVVLVYWISGYFDLLFRSVVLAPLAYSTGYSKGFIKDALGLWNLSFHVWLSSNFVFIGSFVCGLIYVFLKMGWEARKTVLFFLFLFLGEIFSIIKTGIVFEHYLIQLIPFMAVFGGVYLARWFSFKDKKLLFLLVIFLVVSLRFNLKLSVYPLKKIYRGQSLFSDSGYRMVDYLNRVKVKDKYGLFFCGNGAGYFLTGAKIPTKYVHLSNIGKPFLLKTIDGQQATSQRELEKILAFQPVFITINRADRRVIGKFENSLRQLLFSEIKNNYYLAEDFDGIQVYFRRGFR
jgi:hypothetical protein